jgi:hypothetical protein
MVQEGSQIHKREQVRGDLRIKAHGERWARV